MEFGFTERESIERAVTEFAYEILPEEGGVPSARANVFDYAQKGYAWVRIHMEICSGLQTGIKVLEKSKLFFYTFRN